MGVLYLTRGLRITSVLTTHPQSPEPLRTGGIRIVTYGIYLLRARDYGMMTVLKRVGPFAKRPRLRVAELARCRYAAYRWRH